MPRARPQLLASRLHGLFTELMFNMKAAGIGSAAVGLTPGWVVRVPARLPPHAPRLLGLGSSHLLLPGPRTSLLLPSTVSPKASWQPSSADITTGRSSPPLPPFIGQTAPSFEGVVQKVSYRGPGGKAILSVEVQQAKWADLKPYVKHKDLRKTIAQNSGSSSKFYDSYKIKNRLITVCGEDMSNLGVGSTCSFSGRWHYNEKWGLEVLCKSFTQLETKDPRVLKQRLKWLMEGVGDKTAAELVDKLGLEAEQILASPQAVQELIAKGYSAKKAHKLKAAYDNANSKTSIEQQLTDLGLKPYMVSAGMKKYGAEGLRAKLSDDVYATLMYLPGFDLTLADRVARQLGTSSDHPSRGAAALLQALLRETLSSGHSFVPFHQLRATTKRVLTKHDALWAEADWKADSSSGLGLKQAGGELPFIASTKAAARQPSIPPDKGSPAPIQPFVGLADKTSQKASSWAAQLMRMKKVVVEVVTDPAVPPVRLAADQYWVEEGAGTAEADTSSSSATSGRSASVSDDEGVSSSQQPKAWPEHAMVYLDPLYAAETQVSRKLGDMLTRIPADLLSQQLARNRQTPPPPPVKVTKGREGAGELVRDAVPVPAGQGDGGDESTGAADTAVGSSSSTGSVGSSRPWYGSGDPLSKQVAEQYVWQAKKTLLQQQVELTEKQVDAVFMAMSAPVMLLTGAAGCGKTFGTKAIMAVLLEQGKQIMLAAPTGRAAQRLQEAGSEYSLTASTVHRLLGYKPLMRLTEEDLKGAAQNQDGTDEASAAAGDEQAAAVAAQEANSAASAMNSKLSSDMDQYAEHLFEFNSSNPLPAHAVLIDEASMLDVQLAAALLRALPSHCQLILIGDPNQLPPVGPGSLLQDMISTGLFPQVHLDTIFRQSSGSNIIAGAHQVMHGRCPIASADHPALPATAGPIDAEATPVKASSGMPAFDGDEVLRRIRSVSAAAPGVGLAADSPGPEELTYRQANPVQPLMPTMSDDEEGLREREVEARLQEVLGGDGVVVMTPQGDDTQAADLVVQLVSQLKAAGVDVASNVQVLSATKETQAGVNNLNRLLQPLMNPMLRPEQRVPADAHHRVRFKVGDRVVQVENNYDTGVFNGDLGRVIGINEKDNTTKVQFAPRPGSDVPHEVPYHAVETSQLQLAWATTVHKAQGAEYPVVVMVMHDTASKALQQRKLLYTAITRGRKLMFLVTSAPALEHATTTATDKQRNTLLQARTVDVLRQTSSLPDLPVLPYPEQALVKGSVGAGGWPEGQPGTTLVRRRQRSRVLVQASSQQPEIVPPTEADVQQQGQAQSPPEGSGAAGAQRVQGVVQGDSQQMAPTEVVGVVQPRRRRGSQRSPPYLNQDTAWSSAQPALGAGTQQATKTAGFHSSSPAPLTMDAMMFGQPLQQQPLGVQASGQQHQMQPQPGPPQTVVSRSRRKRRSASGSVTTLPAPDRASTPTVGQAEMQGAPQGSTAAAQQHAPTNGASYAGPPAPGADNGRASPPAAQAQVVAPRPRKRVRQSQVASASPGVPAPAAMASGGD